VTSTVINLPMPPSVNSLWRHGKGRVFCSKRYRTWLRVADTYYLANKRYWLPVKGHFRAVITLNEKKRRGDADNRVKAVFDFLQRVEIIENDSLCDGVTVEWGWAPEGCHVLLIPSSLPVTAPGRPVGPQRADGTYEALVG
jgi:crossover junction endodeoxyribonuclease RusA